MKELTKKILESGLVEKHAAKMFEEWGQLERGAADLVGQRRVTEINLARFADDIEQLLEESSEPKETRFEIRVTHPPVTFICPQLNKGPFAAVEDELGRYIVAPQFKLFRGAAVTPDEIGKIFPRPRWWKVLECEPLHQGEKLVAYQVTVDKT